MPSPRGRMVALMASLAVVSLAGCSSGGGTNDDGAASAAGNATSGNAGAGASDDELGYSVRNAPGPLDALVRDSWPATAEEVVANVRAEEERVALCMAEQGFEYIPVVPSTSTVSIDQGLDFGSPAFVEQYAFGINTASDSTGVTFGDGADPNASITERMSPVELDAYRTALMGDILDSGEDDNGTWEYRADNGCAHYGRIGIDPGDSDTVEAFESAEEFLRASWDSNDFDALNAEWSACMRDHGYIDRSPESLVQRMFGRDEDSGGTQATPEEEMDAARADLDCRRQTHYDTRYRDLNHAQQEEYIAKNPDLAALVNQ